MSDEIESEVEEYEEEEDWDGNVDFWGEPFSW